MNEVKLREVIEESLRAASTGVEDKDYANWAKRLAVDIVDAQNVDAARVLAEMQQARKCRHCGEDAGHDLHP
jgi:hypothetical protein